MSEIRHDYGDTIMTSSCSVMKLHMGMTHKVAFRELDMDEPAEDRGRYRKVVVARDDWEEMGCPDTITVVIEPGDKLNGAISERVVERVEPEAG